MSKKSVIYCERSTISEAWAVVEGVPSKFEQTEIQSLPQAFKKAIPGLSVIPTTVYRVGEEQSKAPFWIDQFGWNDGFNAARVGHKYISVHTICRSDRKYETFGSSIRSEIERAVPIFAGALTNPQQDRIGTISFGYINIFRFSLQDFDISRYFNLSFKVNVGTVPSLYGFNFQLNFVVPTSKHFLTTVVEIADVSLEKNEIAVKTQIMASDRSIEGLNFASQPEILDKIVVAKNVANEAFFDFVTAETSSLMGVRYAE